MQLLDAFALTAFSLLDISNGYGVELENLLNEVEKKLPAAAQVCQGLRTAEHLDSDFWSILPFNYK